MPESSRRDFLKSAGQGALLAGLPGNLPLGAWFEADSKGSQASAAVSESAARCDVLVVGGGVAGCFAAIKAREQGAEVILVNKGFTGRSGQTPFARGLAILDPEKGHKLDEWMQYTNRVSEYLNNRYWTEICFKNSLATFHDMLSWGVEFVKDADGKISNFRQGDQIIQEVGYGGKLGDFAYQLREAAEKKGVKLVDRVMIAELLKQDGRVAGAVGFSPDSSEMHTYLAKATILCVGACSYKPGGFPPLHQLTGDGEAMAYRAGAEILGKEFIDTHPSCAELPLGTPTILDRMGDDIPETLKVLGPDGRGRYNVDAAGNRLPARSAAASQYELTYLQLEFTEDAGKGPIYGVLGDGKKNALAGGACLGMSIRKADGLWPADRECRSSVPGLFAAGDALGTMQNGAVYAISGGSTLGSAVTGAIAGSAAAKEALQIEKLNVEAGEIARAKQFVQAPTARKGGFSPRWVTQLLRNSTMPYFVSFIKRADRLQAALTQIEFMQEHLVPKLLARDPHELKLAHETASMVLSAEMRLRSALFRTESRGNHYREDYPRRDDQNWLAWTKIRQEQGKMTLVKVPMPKEWQPDERVPYEQRYPFPYPGEKRG